MFIQSMGCYSVLGCIKCTQVKNVSNLCITIHTTENSRILSFFLRFWPILWFAVAIFIENARLKC
jgi:hypothetical protein